MLLRLVYKSARADICTIKLGVACHNKSTMESVGPLCTIMGMVPVRANLTICAQLARLQQFPVSVTTCVKVCSSACGSVVCGMFMTCMKRDSLPSDSTVSVVYCS